MKKNIKRKARQQTLVQAIRTGCHSAMLKIHPCEGKLSIQVITKNETTRCSTEYSYKIDPESDQALPCSLARAALSRVTSSLLALLPDEYQKNVGLQLV